MPTKTKQQKTRLGKPVRLSEITEQLLSPSLRAQGFTHKRIITEWTHIAGEAAPWSAPYRITFPKGKTRGGTLQVSILSGRGPEMQMLLPTIRERCNAVFGYEAIKHIKIIQTNLSD